MNPMHQALTRIYELANCLMWSAAILSVPFWVYVVIYAAPEAQLIAQQQRQDAMWRENRTFCETHGMAVGTREHSRCVEDLMDLRGKEGQRTTAEMAGLF